MRKRGHCCSKGQLTLLTRFCLVVLPLLLMLAGCGPPEVGNGEFTDPRMGVTPSPAALTDMEASLLAAASKGDEARLKELLSAGVNVNARDEEGRTALTEAVYAGHMNVAKTLLDSGADPSLKKNDGATAILLAGGRKELLLLFENANSLVSAASKGDNQGVRRLLDKGVGVNSRSDGGLTPLTEAVWNGHIETVRLLLDRGADPDMKKADGESPLSLARARNHTEIAELLSEAIENPAPRAGL